MAPDLCVKADRLFSISSFCFSMAADKLDPVAALLPLTLVSSLDADTPVVERRLERILERVAKLDPWGPDGVPGAKASISSSL